MAATKAIAAASLHFLQFRIQYASLALLYYDYVLTFSMEVKYIWGKKWRLSTMLYIFCRYALPANLIYLIALAGKLEQSCDTWYKIVGSLSVLGRGAVIITLAARSYALFGQSRYILIYYGLIGVTCIGLDIAHVPGLRCTGPVGLAITGGLLVLFTVILEYTTAILTVIRCAQAFKVGGPWKTQKNGFIYLVFEQGLLFFGLVSLLNTAAMVLNYTQPAGFLQRVLNALTLPLSCLINARFLLYLRAWEHKRSVAVVSGKDQAATDQQATLEEFRAARGPTGTIGGLVDDFGDDPLQLARFEHRNRAMISLDETENASENPGSSAASGAGGMSV